MTSEPQQLTLGDVASRLGVHYMTVYRYVRLGMLPATKQGRSWQVSETDLAAFTAAEPAAAGGRGADWEHRFRNRLLAADEPGSWGVVEAAATSGMELRHVYRELVIPALSRIGTMWESGEIDVATEHAASQVAARIVARLGPRLNPRGVRRGTIVLGSTATELHGLPLSIAADLLRAAHYDVVEIGPNLPADSFGRRVAVIDRVVAVGIGVTTSGQLPQLAETIRAVRAVTDVPIIVGGAGVTEIEATELGADAWARTAEGAVEILDGLAGR
jgi:excisionase family DNA binding protein